MPFLTTRTVRRLHRLSRPDSTFVRWAACAVVRWRPGPSALRVRVYQIDGSDDRVLPVWPGDADVVVAGGDRVDLGEALAALAASGVEVVLCEGGPMLDGQLVAAGLIDEACVTIAPVLAAGDASRIMHGPTPDHPERLRLERVLEQDGTLLLRYVRI